jgi:hypothetical protein
MKELVYQVEFLSDIVLPASSNTEGNIQQLDFIPGSNFLGMVASQYGEFEDSFKVFHSGSVKFGDGHILKDKHQTYKMPLSYFHEKLNDKEIFNHHFIEDFTQFKLLKQRRSGYITKALEPVSIEYNYSQKSAYDKDNRRSKDSTMYGYKAINSGTKWQFCIRYDESISQKDIELIKKTLEGKKRLGKSKSSQYGLVRISQKGINEEIENKIHSNEIYLYLNSRVALVDNEGNATYDLKYLFDNLSEKNIDYTKTQIKTSTFTPYNTKRETKDYERVCINKGSVIVLKDVKIEDIPQFVGAYQSEGFGELLVNPDFIQNRAKFTLKESVTKEEKLNHREYIDKSFEDKTVQFLVNRHNDAIDKLELAGSVSEFVKKYKQNLYAQIKPSQWGKIRSICTSGIDELTQIRDYISNGVKKWDKKQIDTLLENNIEFIKLLSIQMPKGAKDD